MKISLNWLKDYIDIPSTPDELEQILTSLGLEVEGMKEVQSIPGGLEGLVIGEIKSCGKHPNADRLSVTTVDVGQEKLLNIVCGAPNVASGQKVVVATINTKLFPLEGDPFVIKKGKIRGEVSEGMICAEDEIGLGTDHDGIIVLSDEAVIGSAAADYYNIETDTIYNIGLTPNRSDATSHIGVAKDLLAYYKYHDNPSLVLKTPEVKLKEEIKENRTIKVVINDAIGCPRFSGVTISNLTIGPSPDWMQQRLTSIGVRPISNIVDITNYVLHEYGQPLHAYDFAKVTKKEIHVQTLPAGTIFKSLDEKDRKLHEEDLIVCDGDDNGMCIAGVFGGLESGVKDETTEIFLEAAHFNARQLRKTSTRHNLRTDAAGVFEKGSDPANTVAALKRAASLMCQYVGAVVSSTIVDDYKIPITPAEIRVNKNTITQLIGCKISDEQIEKILLALDIEIVNQDIEHYKVRIPTNKADVTREADVIEEILRIYGFNNVPIPSKLNISITPSEHVTKVKLRKLISDVLVNKGYHEMMGLSLVPSSLYEQVGDYKDNLVMVNNTSNIHLDAMRPEMMISSLLASQYNINRQQKNIALFENGRSYKEIIGEDQQKVHFEEEWMTIIRTGSANSINWREITRPQDFYDIKKAVKGIFKRLGLHTYQVSELEDDRFSYGLRYHRGSNVLASFGAVSQIAKKAADVDVDIYYAELRMSAILKAVRKLSHTTQVIPKYPSSSRDLALTLDEGISYSTVEAIIKKNSGSLLKAVHLFDI